MWWGLACSTRKLYTSALNSYEIHCKINTTSQPFPVTLQTLASWIGNLAKRKISSKTIRTYLAGLRSFLVDLGVSDLQIFQHPSIHRMITGLKRREGEVDKRERLPVTRDILLKLLTQLDTKVETHAIIHAAYCLAFAAFLRVGEFTYSARDLRDLDFSSWHLTRKSVDIQADRLVLSLPASKTDRFCKGVTLTIVASNDKACAVSSIQNLFTQFPQPPSTPLFHSAIGPFTREYLTAKLRSDIKRLGIKGNFSGHSFRRGAATSAEKSGLSKDEIQLLGRWKSNAYKLYIQPSQDRAHSTSRRFQSHPQV